MTIEDIDKEIAHLTLQRDQHVEAVHRINGALDAFGYMKIKLQTPAPTDIPAPDPIPGEAA